eukprot:3515532-Pyramimonas_sp.AAC.1
MNGADASACSPQGQHRDERFHSHELVSRHGDALQHAKIPSTPPSSGFTSKKYGGQERDDGGDLTVKGAVTTINVDNTGPLLRYMEQCKSAVVLVQEHKADDAALPGLERRLRQYGYHGIFAPAVRTELDGISSGVAVLAPTYVTVTRPPGLDEPILYDGKMVAAK